MNEFNPYQPPQAAIEDLPAAEALDLAERGTRLGARILDGLVYGGAMLPGIVVIAAGAGRTDTSTAILGGGLMLAGLLAIFVWELVWLHQYGQSIGKRILKIRIVRSDGERATLGRLFWVRMVVPGLFGAIPMVGGLFSLVNICFIFRDDLRCIHDHLADTVVIRA